MSSLTFEYRRLFDATPNPCLVMGRDLVIVTANTAYLSLVRRELDAIAGRLLWDVFSIDEETRRLATASIENVLRTGRADEMSLLRFDFPRPASEGGGMARRFWRVVHAPVSDEQGAVAFLVQQSTDVTNEELLREAVETASPDLDEQRRDALERITEVVRAARDPAELACNAAEIVGTLLGVSRAGYVRYDPADDTLHVERDWTARGTASLSGRWPLRRLGSLVAALRRGVIVRVDDVRADERTRDAARIFAASLVRSFVAVPVIEQGKLVALFFVSDPQPRAWASPDIAFIREAAERTRTATERLRSEAAWKVAMADLRALNATLESNIVERSQALRLYENIVQSDNSPVAAWGPDFRLIAFNNAHNREYRQIYGIEQRVGDLVVDPLRPEEAEVLHGYMARALAGESFVVRHEFDNLARGSACWELTYNPLRDEAGRIIGAFHHASDITGEIRAGAELAMAQDALRQSQKMEAVGQLTGGLAHDFNNLLTGVMGNLELMHTRIARGRTDDLDRLIAAAQGAGRRAASLTQRLLAFSRRQTLDPKPTDVNRLVAGMEDLLRRTMGPSHEVEVIGADGLWIANIDGAQLENALLNLCINARDAMPDGGTLTIETANRAIDRDAARAGTLSPGEYLTIAVKDTGVGMDRQTIERAFEPFFTTKPLGEGTGLGLSMVYGFARQSHGEVRIESEPGEGTTICLYLPRHVGEAEAAEDDERAGEHEAASGQAILLIDDEMSVRHLIDEVLDEAGYTVTAVADGAAGLRVLQSETRIDLLITDVGLPGGMNGRQIADAARALRPRLDVLFITGYAESAAVGQGQLEPGMQLLTKPFTMAALLNKVAEMMQARS